jgi:hypothetical protein
VVRELRESESRRNVEGRIGLDAVDDRLDGGLERAQQCASHFPEPFYALRNGYAPARSLRCSLNLVHGRIRRQPERERGSLAELAGDRQVSTHQSGQSPADRQSEPAALT